MKTTVFRWGLVSALSFSLLTTSPAQAQSFLPGGPTLDLPDIGDLGGGRIGEVLRDPFGFVVGQLQQWLQNADAAWSEISTESILSSLPSGMSGGIFDDLVKTIDGTKGSLGMPDPGRAAQAASEQIDQNSQVDLGEVAPAHQRTVMRNAIDRELTRATAQATVGGEGQDRTKQASETAGRSVQAANQAAQTAQGLDVTQDVMKQMALQNAQMNNLLGAMYTEELAAKVDRAYTNLNLSDISQSLDQEQRARRSRMTGEATALMQIANQSSLH